MTDFEKSIKHEITREMFIKIRDHKYGDGINTFNYTYGDVSSWLTWNRNKDGNIAKAAPPTSDYTKRGHHYDGRIDIWEKDHLPEFSKKITTDVIFLSLNMSGTGKPLFHHSFQNARGHKKIVSTFFNTAAEGGYFTDIIKPDKRLLDKIRNPAESQEVMNIISRQSIFLKEHVRIFMEELDFIGANKPLLIVFGGAANYILRKGIDYITLKNKFHAIVEIWQYAYVCKGGVEGYINDTRKKLADYITIT